jgi:putative hydrolase of the HAD superfamily
MDEPVAGLVFDLDGTLCEYERTGAAVLSDAFARTAVEPFFEVTDYYDRFEAYVPECDAIREIRERCFADLAVETGREEAVGRAVAEAYASIRDHTNVRWLPGAETALETLGERYPLAMVTNGDPRMQGTKLDALGVRDRFEVVVHAGFDAPAKPDPAPFELALDAIDVAPPRAVTVGNSLGHDVAGAHNAGLRSVWLDREGIASPDPEPHHRIESMAALHDEPWA